MAPRLKWLRVVTVLVLFLYFTFKYLNYTKQDLELKTMQTVMIGVLTVPEKVERRSLIRSLYGQMSHPLAQLYFVFCHPQNSTMLNLITAEKKLYNDVIVLDCIENMDNGKSYAFFSSLPKLFSKSSFKFVMKTDDDVFLHIPNLVDKLSKLPAKGVYYGRIVNNYFMAGMGYILSWDLVEWISTSDYPKLHKIGQEDSKVSSWIRNSGLLKHIISDDNAFYDYPDSGRGWAKGYIPETILIHRLKDRHDFIKANIHFMNEILSHVKINDLV